MKTEIVQCKKCDTKNRINAHSNGLKPICGRCGSSLSHNQENGGRFAHQFKHSGRLRSVVFITLLALLAGMIYGMTITPSLLKKDFSALAEEEENRTDNLRAENDREILGRRNEFEQELSAIDAALLRRSADDHYKQELSGRSSFDKRFALSPREKTQLHMQSLVSDSTKSFHDAIRAVAKEASPSGADIGVRESSQGIALHIDFNMSSMTSGENGTRTKHLTKESLRKEVVSLISRVTNDIFQFCNDLELASIHIGCRHIVKTRYEYGETRDENTMLYKVGIQKSRIGTLTNNPFLDVYSTTRHLEVDEDNFGTIEIVTEQI
jgi:hypothetical protein